MTSLSPKTITEEDIFIVPFIDLSVSDQTEIELI